MEEMNITEVYIGIQGSGKSWAAQQRAAEIAAEFNCPIVVHDCGSAAIRNPDNPYHHTDWKLYTKSEPPPIFFVPDILVVNTEKAEDAVKYAEKVQRRGNIVLLIDEVSGADAITPQRIGNPWRKLIAQRRGFKTALLLCMQSPTMASRFVNSTATSIKLFRMGNHEDELKAARRLGFSLEDIETAQQLKRGQYLERNQGFGS